MRGLPHVCLSNGGLKCYIIVGCHKMDHDTFMNAHESSKLFKPIGKIVSVTIFSNFYKVLVSIVIEEHLRWVMRSPLPMIFWRYLNVVSINMECLLKLIYDCASQEIRWGMFEISWNYDEYNTRQNGTMKTNDETILNINIYIISKRRI